MARVKARRRLGEFGSTADVSDFADSAVLNHELALTARVLEIEHQQERRQRSRGTGETCIDCGDGIAPKRIQAYRELYGAIPIRCTSCESKRES